MKSIESTVFIVTYGRSGSTLLQGVINSIDGYHIKGENLSALVPLFRSCKRIDRARYEFGKQKLNETDPWYGADQFDSKVYGSELARIFIEQVLKPRPGTRVSGFKEIRFGGDEFPDVNEAIEFVGFIRDSFPNAKIIFNERNVADVAKSAWWAKRPDSEKVINNLLCRMKKIYEAHKDASYWVNYDEYKKDIGVLEGLFDFLNESFDKAEIQGVIDRKHSY